MRRPGRARAGGVAGLRLPRRLLLVIGVGCALLIGGAAGAFGQDPGPGTGEGEPAPNAIDAASAQKEAASLVQRIQEGMKRIDENLMRAGAEGAAGARVDLKENIRNLEKLLDETKSQSNQVIQDLDALIRSIKYRKSQSSSSQGQPPPPPEGEEQEEQKPRVEDQNKDLQQNPQSQDKENQGKDEPESARPEEGRGQQDRSHLPPSPPPEKTEHPDVTGRWGVLPPKLQNEILNFNVDTLPEKYRKWLEEYYKRVNRESSR
jgi:hypothetical protein